MKLQTNFSLTLTTIFLLVCFATLNLATAEANSGHRGGCESKAYKNMGLPENSLLCLEAGLVGYAGEPAIQHDKDFKYLEFDVRETLDNKIAIYHGGSKGAVFMTKKWYKKSDHAEVPYKDHLENQKTFDSFELKTSWKKVRVRDLTLEQIRSLKLKGDHDQYVPSLEEYLELVAYYGITKPIMVEIKEIYSEKGRERLMELVSDFNENYAAQANIIVSSEFEGGKVGFLIRKQKIKKNLGKSGSDLYNSWCADIDEIGLNIFKTGKHSNICN